MAELNSRVDPKLTDDIVIRLRSRKISTVIEFVVEDSEKLSTLSGLSFKDVQQIKKFIIEKYGGIVKKPTEVLELEHKNVLPTNIESVDKLLNNGLYPGHIYELCGESSSGKTQLCLTIATNIASKSGNIVRYIDTKRDFSAIRIQSMLEAKKCNSEEIDDIMERIRVCFIYKLKQLFKALQSFTKLLETESSECRTRVVILDSLPGILFKTSNNHETTQALNHLSNVLRYIANEFQLSVITVNLVTKWNNFVQSPSKQPFCTVPQNTRNRNEIYPTLGNYWLHVPNTRLLITKLRGNERNISVWKSSQLKLNMACRVNVCDTGVV